MILKTKPCSECLNNDPGLWAVKPCVQLRTTSNVQLHHCFSWTLQPKHVRRAHVFVKPPVWSPLYASNKWPLNVFTSSGHYVHFCYHDASFILASKLQGATASAYSRPFLEMTAVNKITAQNKPPHFFSVFFSFFFVLVLWWLRLPLISFFNFSLLPSFQMFFCLHQYHRPMTASAGAEEMDGVAIFRIREGGQS